MMLLYSVPVLSDLPPFCFYYWHYQGKMSKYHNIQWMLGTSQFNIYASILVFYNPSQFYQITETNLTSCVSYGLRVNILLCFTCLQLIYSYFRLFVIFASPLELTHGNNNYLYVNRNKITASEKSRLGQNSTKCCCRLLPKFVVSFQSLLQRISRSCSMFIMAQRFWRSQRQLLALKLS